MIRSLQNQCDHVVDVGGEVLDVGTLHVLYYRVHHIQVDKLLLLMLRERVKSEVSQLTLMMKSRMTLVIS